MCFEEALGRFAAKREALNSKRLEKYRKEVAAHNDNPGTAEPPKRPPRKIQEEFKYRHCWEVLRESIAFNRTVQTPRKRQRLSPGHHTALEEKEFDRGILLLFSLLLHLT